MSINSCISFILVMLGLIIMFINTKKYFENCKKFKFAFEENHDFMIIGFRIHRILILHDIGKIGIPETILNKPDKLNDEEFNIIKTHPKMGKSIIENINGLKELSEWI